MNSNEDTTLSHKVMHYVISSHKHFEKSNLLYVTQSELLESTSTPHKLVEEEGHGGSGLIDVPEFCLCRAGTVATGGEANDRPTCRMPGSPKS